MVTSYYRMSHHIITPLDVENEEKQGWHGEVGRTIAAGRMDNMALRAMVNNRAIQGYLQVVFLLQEFQPPRLNHYRDRKNIYNTCEMQSDLQVVETSTSINRERQMQYKGTLKSMNCGYICKLLQQGFQ